MKDYNSNQILTGNSPQTHPFHISVQMRKDVWKTYVSKNILMFASNHLGSFKNSSNPIAVQSMLRHHLSQVKAFVAIIVCDWFKIWQTMLSIWKNLLLKFRSRIISPSSSLKPPSLWRLKEFLKIRKNIEEFCHCNDILLLPF